MSAPPVSERSPVSIGPLSRRVHTHGALFRLTQHLEARHGGFLISRLIMMTGIKLRSFCATSPDDPIAIGKMTGALRSLLSNDDFDEIQPILRERS